MKAVLVIDMPESCDMCPLFYYEAFVCRGVEYETFTFNEKWDEERQPWCPLKPMPQTKEVDFSKVMDYADGYYAEGWNDCLEEITGYDGNECPCEYESDLACMTCEETRGETE